MSAPITVIDVSSDSVKRRCYDCGRAVHTRSGLVAHALPECKSFLEAVIQARRLGRLFGSSLNAIDGFVEACPRAEEVHYDAN